MSELISIIDYGAGNIGSIKNMFKKLGIPSTIVKDAKGIEEAAKLVLPGVGHYEYGMNQLKELGMIDPIKHSVLKNKTPILGICLGAQLMGMSSEEGHMEGLELMDFEVVKFQPKLASSSFKIPHMGWSEVEILKESSLLIKTTSLPRFYFVHSYHFKMNNTEDALGSTFYGYNFISAFERQNIYGVQFHPEKSHKYGMTLLKNFSEIRIT